MIAVALMGLSRRLALLTAAMAIVLVLGATAVASHWAEISRLEDYRLETGELPHPPPAGPSHPRPPGNPPATPRGLAARARYPLQETPPAASPFPAARTAPPRPAGR